MTTASMPDATHRPRRNSRARKALIQLGAALGLLLLAELGLRAAGYGPVRGAPDPYVGFSGVNRLFVDDGDGMLVTDPERRNHFNVQRFAAKKPAGVTRIMCLGGSTTYGRPYTDSTSFPGWLRAYLAEAAPDRAFEVINAGGISYASYRVALVMEELVGYDPDLFLVYTGHNEFLEARSYGEVRETPALLLALGSVASGTALFSFALDMAGAGPGSGQDSDRPLLPAEVQARLDGSVGPEAYTRDDAGQAAVEAHFVSTLERMVDLARGADAGLVFITPASELADCSPFRSEHGPGVTPEQAARLDERLAAVDATTPEGLAELRALVQADPRHAHSSYALGEALLARGDGAGARAALITARDEDIAPLRATSRLVDGVRRVASRRDVPLLDWVERVDTLAAELTGLPVPGSELFLDHVHMTPDAYRRLALDLLGLLAARGEVTLDPAFDEAAVERVRLEVEAGVDTEAHVRALSRLAQVLDWAGKRQEARALTERALEMSGGGDAMSLWLEGNFRREAGDTEAAEAAWRQALTLDPTYLEALVNLGDLLLEQRRDAEARECFDQAVAIDPDHGPSHLALGVLALRRGETGAARNAFHRALRADPGLSDAYNQLAITHIAAREYGEAESVLRAGTLAAPLSARLHHNLGVVLAETGRLPEAVGCFEQALSLEPGRPASLHKLGMALMIEGRIDEGLARIEEAAAAAPDDLRIRKDLEQARVRAGFTR